MGEIKKIFRLKNIILAAVFILLFFLLGAVFQPVWHRDNNYHTQHGFYKQPKNTIETVFVGASVVADGFAPTELYERYGICSYGLPTSRQSTLASYYWVKEAYRLHGKSMKTVVMDTGSLTLDRRNDSFYHIAIDNMRFSKVKLEAVKEYSEFFGQNWILNLFPLLSYHERWKELINGDLAKQTEKVDSSTRGYSFISSKFVDRNDYNVIALPHYNVSRHAGETELNEVEICYFNKLVEFCDEKGLRLVLVKTPMSRWTSADYNAVRKFADGYNLDFLDYNFNPYFDEIEFNFGCDTKGPNDLHLNYYGAAKLTRAFGKYLTEKCGSRDVRNDPNYDFMKKELSVYKRRIARIKLNQITDTAKYIEYLVKQRNYAVFAAANGSFKGRFSKEQMKILNKLGLKKLAKLRGNAAYMSVLDNGKVAAEIEQSGKEEAPRELSGTLSGSKKSYLLTNSELTVDGTKYAMNKQGLTLVVYDKRTERYVDRIAVNNKAMKWKTRDYAARLKDIKESGAAPDSLTGVDRKLYLYDKAAQRRRAVKYSLEGIGTDEILRFIKAYKDEEGIQIFISAKGKAAGALSEETRQGLKDIGLSELARLTDQNSYAAVIENGAVKQEKRGEKYSPAEINGENYSVFSGTNESGSAASVKLMSAKLQNKQWSFNNAQWSFNNAAWSRNNEQWPLYKAAWLLYNAERSLNETGLNVVVFDAVRETVVDRMTFF